MGQHSGDLLELADRVIAIRPNLPGHEASFRSFCRLVEKLLQVADESGRLKAIDSAREEIESIGCVVPKNGEVALKFACSVVLDVVAQGWEISVTRKGVDLHAPRGDHVSREELKLRIRAGHLIERDAQLREPSVREFVKSMEQRRLGPRGWASIFSLLRDGRELAPKLEIAAQQENIQKRHKLLRGAISPYLVVVQAEASCEFTGLKLADIWRYFRHTWVTSYKSLPGRSMALLVRDAAAPNHPVIGIAALGSSMAQQTLRDRWIGWDSEVFEQTLLAKPTTRAARWVQESVQRLIDDIFTDDLLKDRIIARQDLRNPTDRSIERLLADAQRASEKHRRFPDAAAHKKNGAAQDWKKQAATPLFRAKRAKTLALLLSIRKKLYLAGMRERTASSLKTALAKVEGRQAIRQLVRLVKGEHVGVDMMDIVVCGAVAPYNALLGGKLMCSLLASPEVVRFYRKRYREQESIIASSMKGVAVTRNPNLVLLATTSLYGAGSSQYNRVRIPLEQLGQKSDGRIEYIELGVSKGYGSYHFSRASIDYLETLLGRAGNGRKVNSIFGEGVNPLMRKIRDGLAEVGMPTDELLIHGNTRLIYCVPLAGNFRDVLLGLSSNPKYLLPLSEWKSETKKLADFWRRRWLAPRIQRPDILAEISRHTLSYPIGHGARVTLPTSEADQLFD